MRGVLVACFLTVALAGCRTEPRAPAEHPHTTPVTTPADTVATVPADDTTTAAAAVRRYYAAIDDRDHATAYALWRDGGAASGKSYEDFVRGFAFTTHTRVEIVGPVLLEGAAGSIYATVPVHVYATTDGNRPQEFVGTYELRRVNDVPGATPEQLAWHIHDAHLRQVR